LLQRSKAEPERLAYSVDEAAAVDGS